MSRVLAACLFPLLVPQPLLAKQLPPVGKWQVNFGDSHCIAQRAYGDPQKPTYFQIKAPPVGETVQLSIVQKGHPLAGVQESARLTIGLQEALTLSQLRFGSEGFHVRRVNLTKDQVQQLANSSELRWSAPAIDYSLRLGATAELLSTIEKCRLSLAEHWNASPEKQAALRQPASINTPIYKLFSTDDYPGQAVMRRQSGMARIVALVDENGKMVDCTIVETSGIAVLDAQTCLIIRTRGTFGPAIGADGKPAKSVFTQRVRWDMP